MGIFGVIVAIAAIIGGIMFTQLDRVDAGYVGVKVDLLGDEKGVNAEEVGVGRYWIGINEDLYKFPTFAVNYVWTAGNDEGSPDDESLTFQSVEGMDIGADVGITYSIDPTMVSELFERYRRGIDEITDTYLRNMVRDALVNESSKMRVNAIYGTGKTDLMLRVEESVRQQVAQYGILIERVYLIGSLRLPERVVAAIDAEISANSEARQRQNEVEGAKAEAEKTRATAEGRADAILTEARAQAEANRLLAQSVSDELINYQSVQKWDGVLPSVTGGATPMISLTR